MNTHTGPVTADDLATAVMASVDALRAGASADWSVPAGGLEWDCWETVEHLADDLFYYAAALGPVRSTSDLPMVADARHPRGPRNTIRVEHADGVDVLLDVLTACGALLEAMVRTVPPERRGAHIFGPADAEASAAMGVLETVVHIHDVTRGLGLPWHPDPDLCARVLARLMPDVARTDDAWGDLLRATGRRGDVGPWRWWNEPTHRP